MCDARPLPSEPVRSKKAGLTTALLISALLLLSACGALESDLEATNNPCISSPATTTQVELICLSAETLENSEQMATVRAAYQNGGVAIGKVNSSKEELMSILTDSPPSPKNREPSTPTEKYLNYLDDPAYQEVLLNCPPRTICLPQYRTGNAFDNVVVVAIRQDGSTAVFTADLDDPEQSITKKIADAQQGIAQWRSELAVRKREPETAWKLIESIVMQETNWYQDAHLQTNLYAFSGLDPDYDHYLIDSTLSRRGQLVYCRGGAFIDNDYGYYPWNNSLTITHSNTEKFPDKPRIFANNYTPISGSRMLFSCPSRLGCSYIGDTLEGFSNGLDVIFKGGRLNHKGSAVSSHLESSSTSQEIIRWTTSDYYIYQTNSEKCNWTAYEELPRQSILSLPKGKSSEVMLDANSTVGRTIWPYAGSILGTIRNEFKSTPFRQKLTLKPDIFDFDKNPIRLPPLLEGATGTFPRYEKVVRTLLSKSSNAVTPIDWEITGIPDWLTVTPAQGSGDTAITFQMKYRPAAEVFSNGVKVSFTQKRNQNTPIEIQIFPEDPPPTLKAVNELGEIDTATLSYFSPVNINIQYYIPNENPDQRSRWYITDLPWWAEVSGSSLSNFSAQCLMASSMAAARGYPSCSSRGSLYVNTTFTLQKRTLVDSSGKAAPRDYYDQNIDSCGLITLTSDTQDPVLAPDGAYWSKQINLCWN